MSSQNECFIDREAFFVLSPRWGKHVICSGQTNCNPHRAIASERQERVSYQVRVTAIELRETHTSSNLLHDHTTRKNASYGEHLYIAQFLGMLGP